MPAKKDVLSKVLVGEEQKKQPHEICERVYGENYSKNALQRVQRELRNRALDTAGLETYPGISDEEAQENENGHIVPYRGKRYYWWENEELKDLWQLSNHKNVHMAQFVAFSLLERNLNELLPPEIASYISPLVRQDTRKIAKKNTANVFAEIENKVELIQHAVPLKAKPVDESVRNVVFSAVLESRVIQAYYDSKYDKGWNGFLTLSLQKLVFKYGHLKVVAYNHECDQIREIYVRRLKDIQLASDIAYVAINPKPIRREVILRTDSDMFYENYFEAVDIGEDQVIEQEAGSNSRLIKFTARLMPNKKGEPEYFDLVNQLCAWADAVEVIAPLELRDLMERRIASMVERFGLKNTNIKERHP